jgi:hypothetical protein
MIKDEMDGAGGMCGKEEECMNDFGVEEPKMTTCNN